MVAGSWKELQGWSIGKTERVGASQQRYRYQPAPMSRTINRLVSVQIVANLPVDSTETTPVATPLFMTDLISS